MTSVTEPAHLCVMLVSAPVICRLFTLILFTLTNGYLQGFSDVGFMDSSSADVRGVTKYLNQYANVSTVLNNYYAMPNGHSTRSAMLTGKHPATLGKW